MAPNFSVAWVMCVACVMMACTASPEDQLVEWVRSMGGTVNAEIKSDGDGVRGLFATQDIEQYQPILMIPAEAVLNIGGPDFESPVLSLLRELRQGGASRYQPYLDTLPRGEAVLNGCNLPAEYVPMLQSPIWEEAVRSWHSALHKVLTGEDDDKYKLTLPEAVGSQWRDVTLEELRYACAVTATRDTTLKPRTPYLMVPIYDMMNHEADCPHYLEPLPIGYGRGVLVMAGRAVKAGEELCAYYADLRDDYSFVHYGFLMPEQHPPRLWLIDHPASKDTTYDSLHQQYEVDLLDLFDGTPEEMEAEAARLRGILRGLEALDEQGPPPRTAEGGDYAYDWLLELQRRRRVALAYEIERLETIHA